MYIFTFSKVEHPFEAQREYKRALNAVKLDKVFAKPFLGALDGHREFPSCLAKHPLKLSSIASASADGEVRLWDLTQRLDFRIYKQFLKVKHYKSLDCLSQTGKLRYSAFKE